MSDAPVQKPKWAKGGPSPNPGGKRKLLPQTPEPEAAQPENTGRKPDGTFAKGNSINPAGRPKGSLNKSTMAALAIMEADAETISRKAVELALGGDLTAIRIVLDRLVAPRRDRPVEIALPKIVAASDLVAAASAIVEAITEGAVTPSEAAALSTAVTGVAKAVETYEIAERLSKLEELLGVTGSNL